MSKTQALEICHRDDFVHRNVAIGLCPSRFRSIVQAMREFETTSFWAQFADSPSALAYLEAHFKDEDALQQALLEEADESHFSLHQWVEALIVLSQWVEVHGLTLTLEDHIGYVSCAAASAGDGASLSHLPSLVHDLLDQYGCERAVKK